MSIRELKVVGTTGKPWEARITPETIGEALDRGAAPIDVAVDVLAVLGRQTGHGCEDRGLCAFIAMQGLLGEYTRDGAGEG